MPFAAALRLAGFRLSQSDLETRLAAPVEKHTLDQGGYAQIWIEDDEMEWEPINDLLRRHGPAIKTLRDGHEVQSAWLDLAWRFHEDVARASYSLPAQTAALAGAHGIDVMFSVCLTSP